MQIHRTAVVALLAPAFLFTCGAAGCASGPLAPLAFLNPKLRKQWQEDEQYGTMFKQRVRRPRSAAPATAEDGRS